MAHLARFRVGDDKAEVLNASHTTLHHGEWWLAATFSAIGASPGDIPTVTAVLRQARVAKLRLYVGAQGE